MEYNTMGKVREVDDLPSVVLNDLVVRTINLITRSSF